MQLQASAITSAEIGAISGASFSARSRTRTRQGVSPLQLDSMLPHLLLAYDFPPIGGGLSRWMGELARHYPPQGLVVSTGQHEGSDDVDNELPNRVDRVSVQARRLRTIQGLLLWSRKVSSLCRTVKPGFIWCGNIKPAAYPANWARERTGVPYGIIVHGTDLLLLQHQAHQSALKRKVARTLMQPASVIVANSRYTRDLCLTVCQEIGAAREPSAVRVVPLGTDPRQFRPGVDSKAVRTRYGLGPGRWMLTVARLTAHKGIDTSLRVLADLSGRHPDLRYAVVGSGDRLGELQDLAEQLRVADRVRFLTSVPDHDLPALYNMAVVYLGVSRQADSNVEGFGIALVEASACSLPVVAGRSGGIPDAVREGETGLLVDPTDLKAVAAAVERILGDSALAKQLGAGGRQAVESYFNWDRVTREMIAIAGEFSPAPARTVSR
jgi:phosphatidyl-myo-inositol dimannoside synthase